MKKKPNRSRFIWLLVAILLFVLDCFIGSGIFVLASIVVLCGVFQPLTFHQCPRCKKYVKLWGKRPDRCPRCHQQVEWDVFNFIKQHSDH